MNDISSWAINGYNDKAERDAAIKLFHKNKKFRELIREYAKINPDDAPYKIIGNPLNKFTKKGEPCGVDLGLVNRHGDIVLLIEVDVMYGWTGEWPKHFYCLSRLARKEPYYIDTPYPYINISFSANHKNGYMTTREIESRYPVITKKFKESGFIERRKEIPLSEAIKVGEWS
mgnify:CR=1 FL=1|tara:strand:- start:264 stop:782 length:519 start_codon:yes stop_codon:yes gene_type:complete